MNIRAEDLSNIVLESLKSIFSNRIAESEFSSAMKILGLQYKDVNGNVEVVDSLDLVEIVANIESNIMKHKGIDVQIVTEELLTKGMTVFDSVETIAEYILEILRSNDE